MSAQSNLNPKQLKMFMPVDEMIDTVDKGDSRLAQTHSPREQWETEDPAYGLSLRDWKMRNIEEDTGRRDYGAGSVDDSSTWDLAAGIEKGSIPPVTVRHISDQRPPELVDGHHRLAAFEDHQFHTGQKQYVPVRWTT